jgi:hypothetical protein
MKSGNTKDLEQHIELASYDDKFLSREEEKKTLEKAISELGFESVDDAKKLVEAFCRKNQIVNERLLDEKISNLLKGACSDGSISKTEFDSIFNEMKPVSNLNENSLKSKMKALIIENKFKVKEG